MRVFMYDKFGFTTTNLGLVNLDFLENNAQDFRCYPLPFGGNVVKCRVRNMRFTMSPFRIKITGSPARFLFGDNFSTLKHPDLKRFIDEASESFNLNIDRLNIHLLDLTDNLIMDHPPLVYKRYMGDSRYFERCDYQYNGLYYKNKQHKLLFYDKIAEAENKKQTVPAEYHGQNIWRYEYSILRKVHRKLGTPLVRITDLLDPDTYRTTVDVWEKMFMSINLIDVEIRDLVYHPAMSRDDFLMLSGIMHNGGLETVLADIEQDYKMGRIKYDAANNRKKKYKKLTETYKQLSGDNQSLKDELVRKVREKAEENRMLL